MPFFNDKYRVESTRLHHRDYSSSGRYFITVCTKDRRPFFGEVIAGIMHRSPLGDIVAEEWLNTAKVRPNVELDEWIIMPDHLHGILMIKCASERREGADGEGEPGGNRKPGAIQETPVLEGFGRGTLKSGSIGAIIGQFKSICTKRIVAYGCRDFAWQPRFFDHVIRDEGSLISRRQYIIDNPRNWELEGDYPENLEM